MPSVFTSQWKQARSLVLTAAQQAAWNTAVGSTYLTQTQRFDGSAVLELIETRRSDIDYSGKQTAFATNGQVTSWDTKFSGVKFELTPWLAGYLFAMLMGKDTVTGSGSPYTHTMTFDESTRTAIPTSLYLYDTAGIQQTVPDMCMNDVTLTINDIGAIMAEMNMIGTGRVTTGSMALPSLPNDSYILGSDTVVTFGPVGSPVSFLGRVMSATFKFENQLSVHKAPGGGLYGLWVRKGNPKFSFNMSIAAASTDDIYTLLMNDTACSLSVAANSGAAAQITIALPQVHLKSAKMGFDGEMTVWQIEGDETSCFDVSATPPISVTVLNAVSAYLAAH